MKISVLITTYGDDAWRDLAHSRALPSALAQQPTEPDEILVHHWPDLSIGPARNATAEAASGDFLIFLDADDELDPGYVAAMREAHLKAVIGEYDPAMTLFYPTVRYMRKGQPQPDLMRPVGDLRHDNFMVIGTMVSRELFERAGGFSDYDHGYEDWSVWAKCWKAGARIVQVPEAIYIAHINPQSAHRVRWRNRKLQVAEHLRVQAELFPEGVT